MNNGRMSELLVRTGLLLMVSILMWMVVALLLRGNYLAFLYGAGSLMFITGMLLKLRSELAND